MSSSSELFKFDQHVRKDGSIGTVDKRAARLALNASRATGGLAVSIDGRDIGRLANMMDAVGRRLPTVIARALNRTGGPTATLVRRTLRDQTGLPLAAIRAAVKTRKAFAGKLEYRIDATGGYTPLKHFNARQTRKGVSATPWGKRRVFAGSFIPKKGGLRGHVYVRETKARFPLHFLWGPAVPVELVRGQSKAAFERAVDERLVRDLGHELDVALRGIA